MVLKGVSLVLHMNRWSWKESTCTNFHNSSEWSWKKSTFAIWAMVLKWVTLHQFLKFLPNSLERSQFLMMSPCSPVMVLKEANFVGMYNGLEMSQLLLYGWWSWNESVCIATLLVALVLAVLSMLCGDVVLLSLQPFWIDCLGGWEHPELLQWRSPPVDLCLLGFLPMVLKEVPMAGCTPNPWSTSGSWPGLSALSDGLERSFCLCLGCMGDILLGSMVNSPLLHSMGVSPLSVGVSLGGWGSLGLLVCWLLDSVAGVGSHWWCRSCLWWVLLPI